MRFLTYELCGNSYTLLLFMYDERILIIKRRFTPVYQPPPPTFALPLNLCRIFEQLWRLCQSQTTL